MRIAASSRIDPALPLIFTMPPLRNLKPPPYFWHILDHLGAERGRVLLIGRPTRFRRLYVLPQAERPFGGGPSRRHLRLMDEINALPQTQTRDLDCVYVSRARLPEGRFAGEAHLDEALAAAGVMVFHPETADLPHQLRLYQRARRLIFSEGSAVHALQLLGHVEADVAVLARRPGNRLAAASLRPRARSLRYLQVVRGLVPGMSPSRRLIRRAGISVLDEPRCIAAFRLLRIDLAPFWDARDYAERRDADIVAWLARQRDIGLDPAIDRELEALAL
jgi:hypothetical protein